MKIPKQSREEKEIDQWNDLLEKTFEGTARKIPVKREPESRPVYKRPVIWIILVLVLVIAAAWFVIQAVKKAELTPDEKNKLAALEQCKDALAQWQSHESYHIRVSSQWRTDQLSGTIGVNFRYAGDIWFYTADYPDASGIPQMRYMKKNGTVYYSERGFNGSSDPLDTPWTEHEDVAEEDITPWPMGFSWESSEIECISACQSSGYDGFSEVSFAVLRTDSRQGESGPYYIHFAFDTNGALTAITQTSVVPGSASSTTVNMRTYRLISTDAGEIAWWIDQEAASVQTLPVLAQCKAALENHQAQTASKIVIDTTAFGVTVQYTYWRDGEDHLVHHDVTNWSSLSGWLLRTGGTTYCQGIAAYYPEDATGYTDWIATELVSDSSLVTWLDKYQWNDGDITLVSTGEEDGNTLVTFTVAGGLPADSGSNTVTFCLNDAGALVYALADVAITHGDGDMVYVTKSAGKFRISYDASEIRSMIQKKISEVSQTPMPLPED